MKSYWAALIGSCAAVAGVGLLVEEYLSGTVSEDVRLIATLGAGVIGAIVGSFFDREKKPRRVMDQ